MASLTPAEPERTGPHYRLYRWVLQWAGHRRAATALFWLSFAEASFFPIPPDVLLMAMALSRPARALRYAVVATAGSVLGGLAGFGIGYGLWHALETFAFRNLAFLGFTPEVFEVVRSKYQANAFLALFTAGFTPIPYKVFTIAAGVFEVGLPVFVIASVLGRGGRFGLVALCLRWLGPAVRPFLDRYLGWLTLAFAALLAGGFWLVSRLGAH